ncbi:hypothetical protein XBKQ1_970005 [Xenorhabdus bovienii str. kraussei Quebec]|uniref:Uncharacterized protein n=1 Tax=Xenorhabdus bovienii str. kraussei Quebec TaxID=1398203 RepID=A0A077PQN3_XENBV|nr:hypothetical protein XBKQ1_970005 [Xenorhabdus bovienii str. kraussei Quebec]
MICCMRWMLNVLRNTIAQGNSVPILYGSREIGGAIISAGVYTEDQYQTEQIENQRKHSR